MCSGMKEPLSEEMLAFPYKGMRGGSEDENRRGVNVDDVATDQPEVDE